jgi:hypothetical protein
VKLASLSKALPAKTAAVSPAQDLRHTSAYLTGQRRDATLGDQGKLAFAPFFIAYIDHLTLEYGYFSQEICRNDRTYPMNGRTCNCRQLVFFLGYSGTYPSIR